MLDVQVEASAMLTYRRRQDSVSLRCVEFNSVLHTVRRGSERLMLELKEMNEFALKPLQHSR